MAGAAPITPTNSNAYIDGLLGESKWNTTLLNYNFPSVPSYYLPDYFTAGTIGANYTFDIAGTFESASAAPSAIKTVYDDVIPKQFEAVSNLDFTEVASNAALNTVDISVGRANLPNDTQPGQISGHAYRPLNLQRGGDTWYGTQTYYGGVQANGDFFEVGVLPGGPGWFVILHEIGHSVGLKHAHEDGTVVPSDRDSYEFTVMTYRDHVGASTARGFDGERYGRPQSLMMLDIQAIQYLYGADFTTNGGNSVYTFSTTTGEMAINNGAGAVLQGQPGANRIFRTIWDGNGIDTYDLSNYATNLVVNLTPGSWSVFDVAQLAILNSDTTLRAGGNVYNALQYNGDTRSLIENAKGGSGADTITGNAANNVLTGNGANDTLTGSGGIDTAGYADGSWAATWRYNANGTWTIASATGGVDNLSQIEVLQFFDRPLRLWRLEGEDLAGDFNGDGRQDVLLRHANGAVETWQLTGSGALQNVVGHGTVGYDWQIAGVGNFNAGAGSTTDDILLRHESGTLAFWSMNGTATGAGTIALPLEWHVHAIADFNGDNTDDLLLRNANSDALVVWQMSNFGVGAGGGAVATVTGTWRLLGTGDFNGDLREDLLWYNSANNALSTWQMNGAAQTGGGVLGALDASWSVQGIADFNADGRDDILWRHTSGALAQWQMNGNTVQASAVFNSLTSDWQIQDVGTYNTGTAADILIRQTTSGAVALWTMNGMTVTGSQIVSTPSNDWWVL